MPEGDGAPAGRPLWLAEGPVGRHRAVDGRRAGLRLARADLPAWPPLGESQPHGGSLRGSGLDRGGGGAFHCAGSADAGNGRGHPALAGERDANVALAASNEALARSKAAVQTRYDLAVEAIETFHTGVSEDFLLKQDQFKELRDRLLKSAQDFYGKLSALLGKETDVASRRALAAVEFRAGPANRQGREQGGRTERAPRRCC